MENTYEKRIGFGTRLGAKLVDVVIIVIIALFIVGPILGIILGAGLAEAASSAADATVSGNDFEKLEKDAEVAGAGLGGFLAGMVLAGPITGLLYTLIEGFTGASPAKMMFGLKVGNENGTQANVNTYMKRWAISNSSGICTVLALIGLSFMVTVGQICSLIIFIGCFFVLAEPKQAFHGKWSKTAIFNKSDLS